MDVLFKIIGAFGVVFIAIGVLINNRKRENILYIIGGLCLEAYSIYLGDMVFIVLQIIFILSAIYDTLTITSQKKNTPRAS